jgi:hypothetical protein
VRDLGGLLQRAGFRCRVVDTGQITVTFTDAFHLMADLRGMGETNTIFDRQKTFTGRENFLPKPPRFMPNGMAWMTAGSPQVSMS